MLAAVGPENRSGRFENEMLQCCCSTTGSHLILSVECSPNVHAGPSSASHRVLSVECSPNVHAGPSSAEPLGASLVCDLHTSGALCLFRPILSSAVK